MSTAKRLGDTVFANPDPLDDLRPSRQRRVFAIENATPVQPTPPEPTVDVVPPPLLPAPDETPRAVALSETSESQTLSVVPDQPKQKMKPRESTPEPDEDLRGKVRFSANVSVPMKQRVENAAYWIPGMTISAITEVALERELRRLEKEFNDGKPFEKAGRLKYGRPRADD